MAEELFLPVTAEPSAWFRERVIAQVRALGLVPHQSAVVVSLGSGSACHRCGSGTRHFALTLPFTWADGTYVFVRGRLCQPCLEKEDAVPLASAGRVLTATVPVEATHGTRAMRLAVGDRVMHTSFGVGTVTETTGPDHNPKAIIGSAGLKKLSLKHAPMAKL